MNTPASQHTPPATAVAVPQIEADRCPRCGGSFVCGMVSPGPCACTTVRLSAATLSALNQRWQRCLCLPCLQALAAGAPLEHAGPDVPTRP